ncbi:MAG: FAD-dependent oxidoreductase, partial [bacterium]
MDNPDRERDVVIYGGTSAAVIAAIRAALLGADVVMVSPDRHLGGLTSGGLGYTDSGNTRAIGSLAREFYRRVWKHYLQPEAW